MAELPPEVLETMRCGLCTNYLSIPPISTVTSDCKKHKCGRCSYIETRIDNRNILFEKMAQIAVFPCSFSECGEKLAWGEVEKHEENCEHRTIRCPVSWKCEEVISVDNLIPHCSVGHRRNVCNESLVNPIDILLNGKKKFTVLLLIKETTPFLVFTTTTSQNIWINVFSLYPHDAATYKLELMSSANECCLSFLNKINPYHPRKHCKRCALKECPDDLHVPAVLELDEYLAEIGYQKVNRDLVTELDLKELRYTVDLNGKLPAGKGSSGHNVGFANE